MILVNIRQVDKLFVTLINPPLTGIHGIAGIQEAATERNWKINNIQHFLVPEDVSKLNVS